MNKISQPKTAPDRFLLPGFVLFAVILMIMGMAGCSAKTGSVETAGVEAKQEAEKSTLRNSGIRAELESRMKAAMAIPESENAWVDYEKASLELKYDNKTDPYLFFNKGVNKENINSVRDLINNNTSVLKLVDQGYDKSSFQPYLDYDKGSAPKIPNFMKLRRLAFFLAVDGDYELMQGNEKQAAQRYMQCMKLGQGVGNNGKLISGMMGIAIERTGMKSLKALLNRDDVSAETCKYITVEMEKLEKNHFTMTDLMDGEMVFPEALKNEMTEYDQWYLEAREAVSGNYRDSLKKIAAIKTSPENTLIGKLVPRIEKAYKEYMRNRAEFRGIILLSAVKAYKAAKGNYPAALSDLKPGFISGIPDDSFSGDRQFIYRVEPGKMILYSVGPDEKDDGGRQAKDKEMEDGDLVFTLISKTK